ncbi:MAG: hypothetical protein ABW321_01205, partial [Polyangiales bacterium]
MSFFRFGSLGGALLVLAAPLLLAGSVQAQATSQVLELDEALRTAREHAPEIRAAIAAAHA